MTTVTQLTNVVATLQAQQQITKDAQIARDLQTANARIPRDLKTEYDRKKKRQIEENERQKQKTTGTEWRRRDKYKKSTNIDNRVQEEHQYEQQKVDQQLVIENAWEKALAVEARTTKLIADGQEEQKKAQLQFTIDQQRQQQRSEEDREEQH